MFRFHTLLSIFNPNFNANPHQTMNEQIEILQRIKNNGIDLLMEFGPKVISATVIMIVGFLVARWIGNVFLRAVRPLKFDTTLQILLTRIIRVIVLLVFVLMALQNLGVKLLPLIAGLGVAGAGIALAMQGVLGNLVAGLTIIFTRPFRVGDYVSMQGVEGRVEAVTLFSTKLSHADRSIVIVPNRKIVGEIMHNYGTLRQLSLSVSVVYGTNIARAVEVVRAVLASNTSVLKDPAPVVGIANLKDVAIEIAIKPWVQIVDSGAASPEIYNELLERFRKDGIQISTPAMRVIAA